MSNRACNYWVSHRSLNCTWPKDGPSQSNEIWITLRWCKMIYFHFLNFYFFTLLLSAWKTKQKKKVRLVILCSSRYPVKKALQTPLLKWGSMIQVNFYNAIHNNPSKLWITETQHSNTSTHLATAMGKHCWRDGRNLTADPNSRWAAIFLELLGRERVSVRMIMKTAQEHCGRLHT